MDFISFLINAAVLVAAGTMKWVCYMQRDGLRFAGKGLFFTYDKYMFPELVRLRKQGK